jgi:hypothetical protein
VTELAGEARIVTGPTVGGTVETVEVGWGDIRAVLVS